MWTLRPRACQFAPKFSTSRHDMRIGFPRTPTTWVPRRGFLMEAGVAGASLLSLGGLYVMSNYHICSPTEMLVTTGFGIDGLEGQGMSIRKKGMVWAPFQNGYPLSLEPFNVSLKLENMSRERVEFSLPINVTLAPFDPITSPELFLLYARQISAMGAEKINASVKSLIHGELRILAASLTIDEIFENRTVFKTTIFDNLSLETKNYGLRLINVNVEELFDTGENKYFYYRKQKALQEANASARVAVAEAKMRGDVGEKEREGQTRQQQAIIEAEVKKAENERTRVIEESNKDLQVKMSEFSREKEIAAIEAHQASQMREAELAAQVERQRLTQCTEAQRAHEMSKAQVDYEKLLKISAAEADALRVKTEADAFRIEQLARADATSVRLASDARLIEGMNQAKVNEELLRAQMSGLRFTVEATQGDVEMARNIFLTQEAYKRDLYPQLASHVAQAFQGLHPNLNVWVTPSSSKDDSSSSSANQMGDLTSQMAKVILPVMDMGSQILGLRTPQQPIRPLTPSIHSTPEKV